MSCCNGVGYNLSVRCVEERCDHRKKIVNSDEKGKDEKGKGKDKKVKKTPIMECPKRPCNCTAGKPFRTALAERIKAQYTAFELADNW